MQGKYRQKNPLCAGAGAGARMREGIGAYALLLDVTLIVVKTSRVAPTESEALPERYKCQTYKDLGGSAW